MSRKEMKRWFEGRIEKVWPERDRGRGQRAVEKENERKFWSRKTQWGNSWKEEEESEIKLSWDFGEKRNNSALYWATCTQTASLLFLMIYILYKIFMQFHPLETNISISQKFFVTDSQTDIFQKQSNCVQSILKHRNP